MCIVTCTKQCITYIVRIIPQYSFQTWVDGDNMALMQTEAVRVGVGFVSA